MYVVRRREVCPCPTGRHFGDDGAMDREHRATWLVWLVPLAGAAFSLAALVVGSEVAARSDEALDFYLADAWVALLYPVVGAWLFQEGRRWQAGVVMLAASLLAVAGLGSAVGTYDALDGEISRGGEVMVWLSTWTWTPYLLVPTVLPLLFLARRSRPVRWLIGIQLGLTGATLVLSAVAPGPVNDAVAVSNPWALDALEPLLETAMILPGVVLILGGVASVAALVVARRGGTPGATAALVGAVTFLAGALVAGAFPYPWADVWTAACATVMPAAFLLERRLSSVREEEERLRGRLVVARDEERRRLQQELHDGVAPRLAGLGLRVEEVAGRVLKPEERRELGEVTSELRASVAELRRILDGLAPEAVDRLGLVGAVRALCEVLAPGRVELMSDDLPALPTVVETAAYRIVGEALQNATRHAEARRVLVGLRHRRDQLHVTITDDGVGGARPRPGGLGLQSMAQRAASLGGTCEVRQPSTGGTVVEALLPVAP
jgi:signal transduction histidine kinase